MMRRYLAGLLLLAGLTQVLKLINHNNLNMSVAAQDRQAAVAGQFYPGDARALTRTLVQLFSEAKETDSTQRVRAILVPHAGYVYSGSVAASGFNQIDPDAHFERIFILASSHRISFGKASVYPPGNYLTPLGKVEVDEAVSTLLRKNENLFTYEPGAHRQEHSIEVQLPFLQHHLRHPFKIVPIVLGTQVPDQCARIAEALKPWFNAGNLFVVSADFSHYPAYDEALKVDEKTAQAFCTNDPVKFIEAISESRHLNIPNLATSMCAWPAALTLLHLTSQSPELTFNRVAYLNSGDHPQYGDKSSVVGYHAITVTEPNKVSKQSTLLSQDDKEELLALARETLIQYIRHHKMPAPNPKEVGDGNRQKLGAFVTLRMDGQLRGCIGAFEPTEALFELIPSLTIASATRDNRFLPVQSAEIEKIHIEISVLTPRKKIKDISEIQLGKHGIYIKKGYQSGTFLPQVATETGWSLEEFLGHCARDKAGIGWSGWKDGEIFVYEAIVFEEHVNN